VFSELAHNTRVPGGPIDRDVFDTTNLRNHLFFSPFSHWIDGASKKAVSCECKEATRVLLALQTEENELSHGEASDLAGNPG
jgi:hypothetical protein